MIFIDNKYTRLYYKIISRAQSKVYLGYTETHHIIPKSIGGSNDPSNLVELTAKEHYICHRLLTKMTTGEHKRKMTFAAWAMTMKSSADKQIRINMRSYSYLKEERAKLLRNKSISEETRAKRQIARSKQIITEETKKKISKSLKGRRQSDETKTKRSESRRGQKHSQETILKMKQSQKDYWNTHSMAESTREKIKAARAKQDMTQRIVTCPYCSKSGGHRNMSRYHFDNCSLRITPTPNHTEAMLDDLVKAIRAVQ